MFSVIESGLGSPYLTQASFESPSGGPWRSGLPPIARISPKSSVTQTTSTGTAQNTRFSAKRSIALSCSWS
jgi:hypothetical protein